MKPAIRTLLFFILVTLYCIGANLAHPITPTIIQELHLHDYMFGVAFAGMSLTNFLFSPFWGRLADFLPSKIILLICCIGYGIGQLLFCFAMTEGSILFARCFSGLFVGGAGVSMLTYLVNTSGEDHRGRNLAIYATITSVAGAFGYLIGGVLGVYSIRLTFFLQSTLLASCGLLFALISHNDLPQAARGRRPDARTLLRDANPFSAFHQSRSFLTLSFGILFSIIFLTSFASTAYDQCFNYYIKDQFGFTSAYNGAIKAVVGFISLAANMTICLHLMQKTDEKRSVLFILAGCALSILGVLISPQIAPFLLCNVLFFAFNSVSIPLLQDMVSRRAADSDSNLVMGFYNSMRSLGMVIGSLSAGFLYGVGAKLSFTIACAAFVLSVLFGAAYRKMKSVRS